MNRLPDSAAEQAQHSSGKHHTKWSALDAIAAGKGDGS